MAAKISPILVGCLRVFNNLTARVERASYKHENDVPSTVWKEELGRLRVWAANVGAHQTGQSSLDFRLRDASHISEEIVSLLNDLEKALSETMEYLDQEECGIIPDEDLPESEDENAPVSGLQYIFDEIVDVVKCLYQMAMLVRKPAQRDFMVGSEKSEIAAFEKHDQNHARDKFPQADRNLTDRLGGANTRRRRYLRYRECHSAKLEQGLDHAQGFGESASRILSETVASEFKSPLNDDAKDNSSDTGFSQTSYAPSLLDGGTIVVPSPPKESAGGNPFVCPYCFCIVSVESRRAWTRHLFQDLRPYSCTSTHCSVPEKAYASRHEWFAHITNAHSLPFLHYPLCEDTLRTTKQYERHLARHLEEIALFVLSGTDTGEELNEDKDEHTTDSTDSTDVVQAYQEPSENESTPLLQNGPLGAIDAKGPPSRDYPVPPPPTWLTAALDDLRHKCPHDNFEGLMHYTRCLKETGLPVPIERASVDPSKTKLVYYPRIRCHDCPGKLYTYRPAGKASFELHLISRTHRDRVEQRRNGGDQDDKDIESGHR